MHHPGRHPYAACRAALGTMHGKGALMAPALAREVGLDVVEIPVDTDALGTFSGEVPRRLAPVDAAITKARLAMAASGCRLGLGSEGTFGPDPQLPFVHSDIELVVLVDGESGAAIVEAARGVWPMHRQVSVASADELPEVLAGADFPQHALIVRAESGDPSGVVKGIRDEARLVEAVTAAIDASPVGRAIVEHDLRAHCSPSRQAVIVQATERLAARLRCLCPNCSAPGWGVSRSTVGLPCSWCGGTDTSAVRSHVWTCTVCQFERDVPVDEVSSSPEWCQRCNP